MPFKERELACKSSDPTTQKILNDSLIRQALVQKLASQKPKPKAIVEELRVHNGNAIADVVALHAEAHCYEIKGCNDKIERITVQGQHYNKAFRRITLVTTERNLRRAMRISPPFWGVILARPCANGVKFNYVRRAALNRDFDKVIAAMTLWKSEMLKLVEARRHQKKPRDYLAQLIADTRREIELSTHICALLIKRHRDLKSSRQIFASCTI